MSDLQTWNYETSVERVRPKVMKLKSLTLDVYHELWTARQELSSRYHRDGTNDPSWAQYCEDIGLSKRNCNRWLTGYDPVERKLIEAPEVEPPDIDEILALIEANIDTIRTASREDMPDMPMHLMPCIADWEPEPSEESLSKLIRAQNILLRLNNAYAVARFRHGCYGAEVRADLVTFVTDFFSMSEKQAEHIVDTPADLDRLKAMLLKKISAA